MAGRTSPVHSSPGRTIPSGRWPAAAQSAPRLAASVGGLGTGRPAGRNRSFGQSRIPSGAGREVGPCSAALVARRGRARTTMDSPSAISDSGRT